MASLLRVGLVVGESSEEAEVPTRLEAEGQEACPFGPSGSDYHCAGVDARQGAFLLL